MYTIAPHLGCIDFVVGKNQLLWNIETEPSPGTKWPAQKREWTAGWAPCWLARPGFEPMARPGFEPRPVA